MKEDMQVTKAVCMMCHSHCPVAVYTQNGHLEKVEEAIGHPHSAFFSKVVRACPRARAASEWYHHPDRLTYPLKRAGEKGEGKWKKITWEQALDEIAGKLKNLKAKYGAETLATSSGTYRSHDEYRVRFFNLFGSPNHVGQGHICYGPANLLSAAILGWPTNYTGARAQSRCIILTGKNPEQAGRSFWYNILDAKSKGCKLIVIDPRRTGTTERADLWLQLRPGSDTALYMGMIKVIIDEGLYDKEFVKKWCYGFDKLAERAKEYPLDKVAEITWVPAEKIREAARMFATNRPAAIYNEMGVEHLANAIEALHARFILPALIGDVDVKGGAIFRPPHPQAISEFETELNHLLPAEQKKKALGGERFRFQNWAGFDLTMESVIKAWGRGFSKCHTAFSHAPTVYRAMITGKPYPVKAMITLSSNPLVTQGNTKVIYKALKSLDLYVVMDYWLTPSAELADYVLPSACWAERPTLHCQNDFGSFIDIGLAALPHSVRGKFDRRRDYDFWRGLGIRLGQEEYWPWKSLEEAYDYRVAGTGHTYKELAAINGGYHCPPTVERKYEKIGFGTPTGKAEFYSTILEKLGYDPLPRYKEPPESPISTPELAKEYPLVLTTGGRFQPYYHSEHRQVEALRKERPDPLVQINPKTAQKLGIAEGDWVWIETPRGRIRQRATLFDGIDPRVVHCEHGWWFPEKPGEEPWLHGAFESNVNVLTDDDPDICNEISGGWPLRALLCKIYKAKVY